MKAALPWFMSLRMSTRGTPIAGLTNEPLASQMSFCTDQRLMVRQRKLHSDVGRVGRRLFGNGCNRGTRLPYT